MANTPALGRVPFTEAIDHFRGKLSIPTERWDDLISSSHAKAFTVAGATKVDVLNDLRQAVDRAITDGTTIGQFRKDFDSIVQTHGWSYNGARGWRTRVIYDTNLRTARAAGRWKQVQRTKKSRPYMGYFTVGDGRVRDQHRAWNATILLIDDPWWNTHYPPNGWGCRCFIRTFSARQLKREGLELKTAPVIDTSPRSSSTTGEFFGEVPDGIDVGWDYNVGKAWLGSDIAFGEKLIKLPPTMRDAALASVRELVPHLARSNSDWVTQLMMRKKALGEIHTVGYLSAAALDYLEAAGNEVATAVITVTDSVVMHMLRDEKEGSLPLQMIRDIPLMMSKPQAILFDKQNPALIYVFDVPGKDKGKVVVRMNWVEKHRNRGDGERQRLRTNSIRTSGLVQSNNLKDPRYEVVEGRL